MSNTRSTGKSGIETSNTADESPEPGRDSSERRCYEAQKQARLAAEGARKGDGAASQRAATHLQNAIAELGHAKRELETARTKGQEASE